MIIGINYSPEMTGIGPYTTGLAEYLAETGHCVDVVTGLPSYPEWKVHHSFRRTVWQRSVCRGVTVHRRWHYVPRTQSALRRLIYEATFLVTGSSAIFLKKPDLVVGVVPTLSGGALARLAAKRFGRPYALIFQDLMGPAASQTGVAGASRVALAVTKVERWVALRAAGVGIIAEGFRPHLEALGLETERIHRVRNWTRIKQPTADPEITRKELGWDQRGAVCLHSGNMGHKQGLENILRCAHLAQERGHTFHFVFVGEGNQKSELQELAVRLGLHNVEFLPLQSEEDFPNVLAAADILLLNQRAGVSEMALPSKLTSYLASGRPIIAAVEKDSETARELIGADAGIVLEPEDPQALLAAITALANNNDWQERLGKQGRDHAATTLSALAALEDIELFIVPIGSHRPC